jgi:hypothetical protein
MSEKALNRTNRNICLLKQRGAEMTKCMVAKIFNSGSFTECPHDLFSLFEGSYRPSVNFATPVAMPEYRAIFGDPGNVLDRVSAYTGKGILYTCATP